MVFQCLPSQRFNLKAKHGSVQEEIPIFEHLRLKTHPLQVPFNIQPLGNVNYSSVSIIVLVFLLHVFLKGKNLIRNGGMVR